MARCLNDDLLPDRPARKIIDVVNLVEDDVADAVQPLGILVNQVAEDFGRHDYHRGQRVDGVFAGHEADVPLSMLAPVVAELLVGERLQRGRVDRARVGLQRPQNRVVGDHGLA